MTEQEQIDEIAKVIFEYVDSQVGKNEIGHLCILNNAIDEEIKRMSHNTYVAKALYNAGYRKLPENSVVLSKEEYEKLRSLYDCEQGSYMTSSIGDLHLTVEGLRKAVDEITRLNRVEVELQEINIKYYNEAKDLRRELKQARKETAEKFLQLAYDRCLEKSFIKKVEELAKQFGVEIKE